MKRISYSESNTPIVRELSEIFDAVYPIRIAERCGKTREWLTRKMTDQGGSAMTHFVERDVEPIRAALDYVSGMLENSVPKHGQSRAEESYELDLLCNIVRKTWLCEQLGMTRNQWYKRAVSEVSRVDVRFTKDELKTLDAAVRNLRAKMVGASLGLVPVY